MKLKENKQRQQQQQQEEKQTHQNQDKKQKQQHNHHRIVVMARKYFHLIAVFLFIPVTFESCTTMSFSYAIAIALLSLLESLRCCYTTTTTKTMMTSPMMHVHHQEEKTKNDKVDGLYENKDEEERNDTNSKEKEMTHRSTSPYIKSNAKIQNGTCSNNNNNAEKGFTLNDFYEAFFDEKDANTVTTATTTTSLANTMTMKETTTAGNGKGGSSNFVVTHAALVFGCAIPLWICEILFSDGPTTSLGQEQQQGEGICLPNLSSSSYISIRLLPYIGIIVVGVGDAIGAVVGTLYGKCRWPGGSKRTLEGSFAMFIGMLLCVLSIESIIYDSNDSWVGALHTCSSIDCWRPLLILTLLEASTCQIDNLCLPLVGACLLLAEFYSLSIDLL